MRFKTLGAIACLTLAAVFGIGAVAAQGATLGPIDNGDGTATGYWLLPQTGMWPQSAATSTTCGTLQVDKYRYRTPRDRERVNHLWADQTLQSGEDSAVVISWSFVTIPCATETETPSSPVTPSTPATITTPTAVPTTPPTGISTPPVETTPPSTSPTSTPTVPVATPTTTPSAPVTSSTPSAPVQTPTPVVTSPTTPASIPSSTPTSASSTAASGQSCTTETKAPTATSTATSSPTPNCASVTSSTPSSTGKLVARSASGSLAYTGSFDPRPVFAALFFTFLLGGTLILATRKKEFADDQS